MKTLRIFLEILLTFILLLLFAAWYFLSPIQLDKLLATISQEISSLTLLPVATSGKLELKLFPLPSLHLPHIEVGQRDITAYFIQLDDINLKLRLKPLFKKKLIFKLVQAKQFAIQVNKASTAHTSSISPISINIAAINKADLLIEKVIFNKGSVEIALSPNILRAENLELLAENVTVVDDFPLALKGFLSYGDSKNTPIAAEIYFKGETNLPDNMFTDKALSLNDLKFYGLLEANSIKFKQFNVDKLVAKVNANGGDVLFKPMAMNLYEGNAAGYLHIDTATGKFYLNQNAVNLNSKLFFAKYFPKLNIVGPLDFALQAQFNLAEANIPQSLTGNGSLLLKNGSINDFNLHVVLELIRKKIDQLLKIIKDSSNAELGADNITINPNAYKGQSKFSLFGLRFAIQHQDVVVNSFIFNAEELQLTGMGRYNLASDEIYANLQAKFDTGDQDVNDISRMLGGAFPVKVTGSVKDPDISPDLEKITPYLQQLVVKKVIQAPTDAVQQQIFQFFHV